jgi:RNA polymerase sigma-70 factor (ECF subfamily)
MRPLLPRLEAFARTIVRDTEVARDLVQEGAARAIAARRVPADARAYRAWMFQIVRNLAIDELRRREVVSQSAVAVPEVDLWHFDDARIAKITVEQALTLLDATHREIVALIDIAGFSYAEAAEILSIPIGTVMSRISRARVMLLAAIDASAVRPLKSSHGH